MREKNSRADLLVWYGLVPILLSVPVAILLWIQPASLASGRPAPSPDLLYYFLGYVLLVGVSLSLVLRHLIQRSRRWVRGQHHVYAFVDRAVEQDPSPGSLLEAGLFFFEAGLFGRALECLNRVETEDADLMQAAVYHRIRAHLELGAVEEAARIHASWGADDFTPDQRYELALAFKRHNFLGRARELFLRLFLMDIRFRDVGAQLTEVAAMERAAEALREEHRFLLRVLPTRYTELSVEEDLGDEGVSCTAFDRDLGRAVLLRVLRPDTTSSEAIEAFLERARELARFDHPSILKVYDIHKERLPYYSLEKFVGAPLPAYRPSEVGELLRILEALVDISLQAGDFDPKDVRVAARGEVRLVEPPASKAGLAWRALEVALQIGGGLSGPPPVVSALQGLSALVAGRATRAEVELALDELKGAHFGGSQDREDDLALSSLAWLDEVHRHWIHALKSKFAILSRYPDEAERALRVFLRKENLLEVRRLLEGLARELERHEGSQSRLGTLARVEDQIMALHPGETAEALVRLVQAPEEETALALLREGEPLYRELSEAVARLLGEHEVDLLRLAQVVSRSSAEAGAIDVVAASHGPYRVRTVRPEELRRDLRAVMDNTFHNSFEAGAKRVTVTVDDVEDGDFVRIAVSDDGPGLPPGLMEKVARDRYSSKEGGTSTGLTSSARMLEAHGGFLVLGNQTVGEAVTGARLEITLPRRM